MASLLQDFFYDLYENLEERLQEGARWVGETAESIYSSVKEPLLWIGEALQGDWNEDRTPAQIAADAVLAMIPVVDQILDIRDICANCKKLSEDIDNGEYWMNLSLSLIGLVPSFGSLAKGVLKIIFCYIRKFGTSAVETAVDASVEALRFFLHDHKVVKLLGSYDFGKCCKKAAEELRSVKSSLDASRLSELFRKLMDNFRLLIEQVERFSQDGELVRMLHSKYNDLVSIQSKIDDKLSRSFGPLSGIMERMAGRLDAHALACEGGPAVKSMSYMVGEAGGSGAAARKGQPAPSADGKAGAPSSTNQTGATAQTNAKNTEEVGKSRLTWQNMPGKTNNAKKSVFGERISDQFMKAEGHIPVLDENRIATHYSEGKSRPAYTVDGIYKKKPPDEGYIITEVKFRTGGEFEAKDLSMTKGSTYNGVKYPPAKQMSDKWILPRIENDPWLTPEQIKDITKNYERWLIVVDENGKITGPIKLDKFANAINP